MAETLIWVAAIFFGGGILALERRCLGQMAVVQPLVVCLIAGWIGRCEEAAIWLGSSLQLFSVGQARQGDWAMSGLVVGATMVVASRLDIPLAAGGPRSCALALVAVFVGIGSRVLDRRYWRKDGERLRVTSPWLSEDVAKSVESLVRQVMIRWLFIGGIAVTLGAGISLLGVMGIDRFFAGEQTQNFYTATVVFAVCAGIALSTLARIRFVVWAGISAIAAWVLIAL